jgi:hypothetical protein
LPAHGEEGMYVGVSVAGADAIVTA